jgi:glucokinase
MAGIALGIDIGGTKLAAGLVAADGSVLGRARATTPAGDAEAIVEACADVAQELVREAALGHVAVGVGAAGMIDLDGVVRYAPNIAWADFPLRDRLAARLWEPVVVHNDANVAAWGEFRCGAARDATSSMVMLTIGTGVGGGLVQDGRLVRGAHGFGAEFGHTIVCEGGARCPCGNAGCLEAYASGSAIGRAARERLESGDVPATSALHGLDEPTGKSVTIAAHAGDTTAVEIVEMAGRWLGVGIATLVNAIDPEIVVLGGGAMEAGELLLGPARETMATRVMGHRHRELPPVVRSALADDAGFVGAALLALAR